MNSILIVDDNVSDRLGINGLIDWDALGIHVVGLAADGVDGYEQAVRLRPDFILTDISMPRMDGIQMTQRVREQLPDTKFLFMSCHDEFGYLKRVIDLRVHGYVLKPIELPDLTRDLQKLTRLKGEEDRERRSSQLLQLSLPMLQELRLKELLRGGDGDFGQAMRNCAECGLELASGRYQVLYVQIDHYGQHQHKYAADSGLPPIEQVKRTVNERLLRELQGWAAIVLSNGLAVVLADGPEAGAGEAEERGRRESRLASLLEACKADVYEHLGLTLTVSFGDGTGSAERLPDLLKQAEAAVAARFNAARPQAADSGEDSRYGRIVKDIKDLIDAEYGRLEHVAQIIEPLFISASHANLIFKQHTGQTIFEYLACRKMEAAKQLLQNPYVKVYEVAEKTGYKTQSYFAAAFKEYTGMTPMQFKSKASG